MLLGPSPLRAQSMDYGSLEQLFGEPVTTSATGSPQRVTEVPANMTIITADEIRRSGARDIPGVLRHVAGVDVMQWASDHSDVAIRGYNEQFAARMLVLIDGRQVYADYYGFIPWSALPVELSTIRQIEIVKGPNAALFGFNAVGGVINIITYSPRYDDVNTVSASTGTRGQAGLSGTATMKLGTAGALRLSGALQSEGEFNTPIPPAMVGPPRAENNRFVIDANAIFKLGNNVELGVEASHFHLRQNDLTPGYVYEDSRFETNSVLARLTADTDIGLLKFTAYSNWLAQRTTSVPLFGVFAFRNRTIVAQAEDVFGLGADHDLRLAVEYRHNISTTSPYLGGKVFYDVVTASGIWHWRIAPTVSLTNALRFDHLSLGRSGVTPAGYPLTNANWGRSTNELSFNSGLVWQIDVPDTLRLIVSRGVELPSLAKSGALLISTPYLQLTGIPTLQPTTVTNFELAWDHNLASLAAQLRASFFHQHSENLTSTGGGMISVPGGVYLTPSSVGDSDADGLEISVHGLMGRDWRWSLSYRAELVHDNFNSFSAAGGNFIDYEHTTPKHMAKANIGWTHGKWEADAYLGFQSDVMGLRATEAGTTLVPVGAYVTVDGRVAYQLTDWATLAISGQNLLQSPQRQTGAADIERQVMATLNVHY